MLLLELLCQRGFLRMPRTINWIRLSWWSSFVGRDWILLACWKFFIGQSLGNLVACVGNRFSLGNRLGNRLGSSISNRLGNIVGTSTGNIVACA